MALRAINEKDPRSRVACPTCGRRLTYKVKGTDLYYCCVCRSTFEDAPQVPYDLVLDAWDPALGVLQQTGDIIAVRLPEGFIGVCILSPLVVPRERVR